jgi:hypothetical protein
MITHDQSLTPDDYRNWVKDEEIRVHVSEALEQYELIIIHDPETWRRYCRHQLPEYKRLREYVLRQRVVRRGAPRKSIQEREDALVAGLVEEAKQRLSKGCDLRRQLKKAGGAASDDTEIRPKLAELGYDDEECRAILRTKQPLGAAVVFVARRLRRKDTAIRSSLSRATKHSS